MSFDSIQILDPLGYAIGALGVLVGAIGLLAAWLPSRRRRINAYLKRGVPRQAAELLAKSLYAHLPQAMARHFSNAWIRRMVEEFPDQHTFEEERLCHLTRLFIEQVHIDRIQAPEGRQIEPARWPGQPLRTHFETLEGTLETARGRLSKTEPHGLDTSFALQDLMTGTPPVSDYFEALRDSGISRLTLGERDRFLSLVQIQSGFVAPLHLLTGLLTEMSEDWPRVLARFSHSVTGFPPSDSESRPDLVLEHVQAFQFYCWLLWGPSIQLCTCEAWTEQNTIKVLQYGYGDENNSLHLIFDDARVQADSWAEIRRAFQDRQRPYPLAVQTVLTARPMWGPNLTADLKLPWIFDPLEQKQVAADMTLLLRCEETVNPRSEIMLKVPYYSAYVWIMLEICDPRGRLRRWCTNKETDAWRHYLPIFEHGNIADGTSLLFNKRSLVGKTLTIIDNIERSFTEGEGPPAVYLRYVCAIDDPGGSVEDGHALEFAAPSGESDSLRTLLKEAVGDPARHPNLFEEATPDSTALMLDTSCHLSYVVQKFYQGLATRG